eukprot:TRINITY_DN43181_c0_g1_i1.p1 TRINITY_DN43181_c0_g1~~TRINITY_DN43181_c0_g1_i1.p1  ORF type:complete len:616 (+),score=167.74 TRINITY_DN43181_c0_g1_i1:151-1998(+)
MPEAVHAPEWAGAPDDSDEEVGPKHLEKQASASFEAREHRLSVAAQALKEQRQLADHEVEVLPQQEEWTGHEDSEDEPEQVPQKVMERRASASFEARERRLSAAAAALKEQKQLGDCEVEVLKQSNEWAGAGSMHDSDDEQETETAKFEKRASQSFMAREQRISLNAEALHCEAPIGDKDVEVIAHSKEWTGAQDSDDEQEPSQQKMEKRASASYEARERRLSASAEVLNAQKQLGDQDVEVVTHSKEWEPHLDSEDEHEPEARRLERQAESAFAAREHRLSLAADALREQRPMGDHEVKVVPEQKEWGGVQDSDDEHEPHQRTLERRASESFAAREKRLSIGEAGQSGLESVVQSCVQATVQAAKAAVNGASTLEARTSLAGRSSLAQASLVDPLQQGRPRAPTEEVAIVSESKEWKGADESDDENAPSPVRIERRASASRDAREHRLSVATQILQEQKLLGDREVEVVPHGSEWKGVQDSEDEADPQPEQQASASFQAREQRLSQAQEALHSQKQLYDHEVEVHPQQQEWAQMEESEDEPDGQLAAARHASGMLAARERRLSSHSLRGTLRGNGEEPEPLMVSFEQEQSALSGREPAPADRCSDRCTNNCLVM